MNNLKEKFKKDLLAWDECAETYERQIVSGHPDINAFENFEEDFLDRLLIYLIEKQNRPIKLMDIGCGSGRLHLRYGIKTINSAKEPQLTTLANIKRIHPELAYDFSLEKGLSEVWGIDFSSKMLNLAKKKIKSTQLKEAKTIPLTFKQGSAFELEEQSGDSLPVAVNLVNSISVMQGPMGAIELFKSMRRLIEASGGIAIISNYQKEYIESYGLGQYESTLDVSGQPWWTVPDTYASLRFRHKPKHYICANRKDPKLLVDIYDRKNNLIKKDYILRRSPKRTAKVIKTGHIRTHTDYESQWYSFKEMDDWIKTHWSGKTYHFKTKCLDKLRAEPAQISVLDSGNLLKDLFERWQLN